MARNTRANWTRTVKRLRRNMAELRSYDCETREPDNFETPPSERVAPPPDHRL